MKIFISTIIITLIYSSIASSNVSIQYPALDHPFNTSHDGRFPSMQQSLSLTNTTMQLGHYAILDTNIMSEAAKPYIVILFQILMTYMPMGDAWIHEEWHRAVLSRRGIDSFNDVYKLQLFADTISVSHVRDKDLIYLKKEHPQEQIRLSAAGIEAQYESILDLEKNEFFNGTRVWMQPYYWLSTVNSIFYIYACTTSEADEMTDEINTEDGANMEARDFTGLDFTAWVYDLHRPDEPYEARGIHPTGVGINRYRKRSDLSQSELSYLKLQSKLALLNLLDPQFLVYDRFYATNPFNKKSFEWNFNLKHILSSFGYTINLNIFLKQNKHKFFLALHNYFNKNHYFPGLDISLLRYPMEISTYSFPLSIRIFPWLQPRGGRFRTGQASPGALLAITKYFPIYKALEGFVEIEGKTNGWVAGNVYLDAAWSTRLGIFAELF